MSAVWESTLAAPITTGGLPEVMAIPHRDGRCMASVMAQSVSLTFP